jgi:hypothetical protein
MIVSLVSGRVSVPFPMNVTSVYVCLIYWKRLCLLTVLAKTGFSDNSIPAGDDVVVVVVVVLLVVVAPTILLLLLSP